MFSSLSISARRGLSALLALQLFVVFFVTPPGHFTDSLYYVLEIKNLLEHGSFVLRNGYEELPSELLRFGYPALHDGKQYSQYPALYSFLALPFYAALGETGLFLMNALALVGVVGCLLLLARRLFPEEGESLGWAAALILLGGTYFWGYSQAIWPHMIQLFLLMLAAWLAVEGWRDTKGRSFRFALAAGGALGLACGVRLDTLFAVPAIGTLILLGRRPLRDGAVFALAMLPSFLLLAGVNDIKFGVLNPFSYGRDSGAISTSSHVSVSYDYITVGLALGLAHLAFLLWARSWPERLHTVRRPLIAGLLVLAGGIIAGAIGPRFLEGMAIIWLDMRGFHSEHIQHYMTRGEKGSVLFESVFAHIPRGPIFKKAFLQSVPWAPLALLAFCVATCPEEKKRLVWLALMPVSYLVIFAAMQWHGGSVLNMRYLLPALPFLALLMAFFLARYPGYAPLREVLRSSLILRAALLSLLLIFIALTLRGHASEEWVRQLLFLDFPLLLGGLCFAFYALYLFQKRPMTRSGCVLLLLCIGWGGIMMLHDHLFRLWDRSESEKIATLVVSNIEEPALVFGVTQDMVSKTKRVHFGNFKEEHADDFRRVADYHLAQGYNVYLFSTPIYDILKEKGQLASYEIEMSRLESEGLIMFRYRIRAPQGTLP